MTALLMIGDDGAASMVWHRAIEPPRDGGAQVRRWLQRWQSNRPLDAAQMAGPQRMNTRIERNTA
jgi:hypothetical protein